VTIRILVKAAASTKGAGKLSISGKKVDYSLKPLMPNIDDAARSKGPAMAAATTRWQALALSSTPDEVNPWDACHAAVARGLGFAGGGEVAFAEPDLEHAWAWMPPGAGAFAAKQEKCEDKPLEQDLRPFEGVADNDLWFLDAAHSGLAAARDRVVVPAARADRVRIAHFDTGFDPNHASLPSGLRADLGWDFVDDDGTSVDERGGLILKNFGHGAGTLALLAGKAVNFDGRQETIGGAANLEVGPFRIANSVVLFRTSAVAAAFDRVYGLWDDPETRCHVVSMSMGGLASAAWAEAANRLYERGIFVVTAAGNNVNDLPTRFIVYPARFRRVLAACGVMAGGSPYTNLPGAVMQGCYGPKKKMLTAMSAWTPNVPWAKFGCGAKFNRNGGGTSCATPQIAAAAALWMQKHAKALKDIGAEDGWKRVELCRAALMKSAGDPGQFRDKLGAGSLRAAAALDLAPKKLGDVLEQKEDNAAFALIRGLAGLGVAAEPDARTRMLELEALQLSQQSREIEAELEAADIDPDDPAALGAAGERVLEAIAADARASNRLRATIHAKLGKSTPPPRGCATTKATEGPTPAPAGSFLAAATGAPRASGVPQPTHHHLRVYAFDPSLSTNLDYFHLNEARLPVRWESGLAPGPVGEYLEVIDVDPAAETAYAPVDLNHPALLAQDGHAPSEGNPQFHQQMVYAVSMRTIEIFEKALGRVALWSEHFDPTATTDSKKLRFVRRLRIHPHALREANAYYSPERKALLFGYFTAATENSGDVLPGGVVFTCLSHDIIAHETAHALLDGLHPRFGQPTNLDVLAFHEAFSDVVALFQHFMMPEALELEIGRTRGNLEFADLLGNLAVEFGQAIQNRKALRSAIAFENEKGEWERTKPSTGDYERHTGQHARGAVLVAAVFDAFIRIYRRETEPVMRLATGGSGVLPPGAMSPILSGMLAGVAAKLAARILNVCIRALDYCPPVDVTFGEFLRAMITADREFAPDDERGYRVAFVSAFRERGIYPEGVTNISTETLAWRPPAHSMDELEKALASLDVEWNIRSDRYQAYLSSNDAAMALARALRDMPPAIFDELGIVKPSSSRETPATVDGNAGNVSRIEVHSVRPAVRVRPSGDVFREIVIELTQKFNLDGESFRGGCTIIFDPEKSRIGDGRIKYVIRKRVGHKGRIEKARAVWETLGLSHPAANYFSGQGREPFAFLHRS